MAIKELKKLATYKDGEHDWIVSATEINGTKTVGIRRWKTRGEGYTGPTRMGINIPPKYVDKMLKDGSLQKAIEAAGGVEEEEKKTKKKNGKTKVKKAAAKKEEE